MMSDFIFIVPFLFASLLLYATKKLRDYILLRIIVLGLSVILFGAFIDLSIAGINKSSVGDLFRILQLSLLLGGTVYYICALTDLVASIKDERNGDKIVSSQKSKGRDWRLWP